MKEKRKLKQENTTFMGLSMRELGLELRFSDSAGSVLSPVPSVCQVLQEPAVSFLQATLALAFSLCYCF